MKTLSNKQIRWLRPAIILGAAICFLPFIGNLHLFDWDEINFAEAAREMIVSGDYLTVQIDYQPFWEKPPLFIYFQVISMKLFGIGEFAARLPNALCGIFTLLILFEMGRKIYDYRFGLFWVLSYAGSWLPHFYFKSGIIDPWFNVFIFLGIYFFILFIKQKEKSRKTLYIIYSAVAIGFGILTKGPVALMLFGLTVLFFWLVRYFFRSPKQKRQKPAETSFFHRPLFYPVSISLSQIVLYLAVVSFVGGFWFILQIINGRMDLIMDFIDYQVRLFQTQDAGHGGFMFYHFVVLLFGVFPTSVFALRAFKECGETDFQRTVKRFMIILLAVVLAVFTIVNTKIVHYSSLSYFPLTYLSAFSLYHLHLRNMKWTKPFGILLVFCVFVIAIILLAIPLIGIYTDEMIGLIEIKDTFALANLEADVHWSGFEFLIGIFFLVACIVSIFYFRKTKKPTGLLAIFVATLICTQLIIYFYTPKIERYTQHAAIEFYQQLQNKDCHIETLGFKSYAHLFYTRKKQPENGKHLTTKELLEGKIEKNAYFVCKINRKSKYLEQYPELKLLYEKNGFVFLIRRIESEI